MDWQITGASGWDWTKAVLVAVVFNLALFLVMPALIAVRPQKQSFEQLDQHIILTKVRQEQEQKKKEKKLPEPPKEKPEPLRPTVTKMAVQRPKLSLPFELNTRLPAITGSLELPPIDTSLPQADVSGLFSVGDLDGELLPLAQLPPEYPYSARRRRVEGWVKVQFIVNEQGRVESVRIVESKPAGIFDSAVQRAVSRWRFKPGTIGGTTVKTRVEQTVVFKGTLNN